MSLDPTRLAEVAAEFIDGLEEDHPDAELARFAFVAELDYGDGTVVRVAGEEVEGERTHPTMQAGLLTRALIAELTDD